jgi:hypothetical protein
MLGFQTKSAFLLVGFRTKPTQPPGFAIPQADF